MNISSKAYLIGFHYHFGERIFPLSDLVEDVLWTAYAYTWDPGNEAVRKELDALKSVVTARHLVREDVIDQLIKDVKQAITSAAKWHTPETETTDRRPHSVFLVVETAERDSVVTHCGSYEEAYKYMKVRFAEVLGCNEEDVEAMEFDDDHNLNAYNAWVNDGPNHDNYDWAIFELEPKSCWKLP